MNSVKITQMSQYLCDHMDGDVDTKPAFDPPEYMTKITSSFLSIKPENHNCKGMSLRLNK